MSYPASNFSDAVALTITSANQLHEVINGESTDTIIVESGVIPSLRKALIDNFYFVSPIDWNIGQDETVFNQVRQFTDGTFWIALLATDSNPITMGSTPYGDSNWTVAPLVGNRFFDEISDLEQSSLAPSQVVSVKWVDSVGKVSGGDFEIITSSEATSRGLTLGYTITNGIFNGEAFAISNGNVAVVNSDEFGWRQALLTATGLVPNGDPEKVGDSQYLDALRDVSSVRSGVVFSTLANLQAGNDITGASVTFKANMLLGVFGENESYRFFVVDTSVTNIPLAGGLYAKEIYQSQARKKAATIGDSILNGNSPTIATYGDSTFWGATPGDLPTQDPNYPAASLVSLILNLTGETIVVQNRAISGTTLRQMLAGTDGSGSTYEDKIKPGGIDEDISLVYCNHAINDNTTNDIGQYKADLTEFVTLTRRYDKVPVIVTPNPCSSGLGSLYTEEKTKRLKLYVEIQRTAADELGVDLVDNYEWFEETSNQVPLSPNIVGDGVHLTTRAYRQSGYNLSSVLFKYKTISDSGDVAGIYDCQYNDNLSLNRALVDSTGARTSGILSGDKTGTTEGVNFGCIFGKTAKSYAVVAGQWAGASKNTITLVNSGNMSDVDNLRVYGTTSTVDWDGLTTHTDQVWAGVNVFSLFVKTGDSGAGNTLSFGGIAIPSRHFSESSDANGVVLNEDFNTISNNNNILLNFNLTASTPLIFNDKSGGKVLEIAISGSPGQITQTVFTNGVGGTPVNVGGASSAAGFRTIQVQFASTTITTLIDGAFSQIPLTNPVPNLRLASPLSKSEVYVL